MVQLRALTKQFREDTVAEQVRNFVPVADRVQALEGRIVRVIAGFARLARPAEQRRAQAVPHLLLLLVQQLLRHLFPREPQITHGGNQPQTHRAARRKQERALVAVVVLAREELGRRTVREIARGDNVWQWHADAARNAAAFRQVDLQKSAVAPGKVAERLKRLYDPRALSPAAAGARREGSDGDLAAAQRVEARLAQIVHWSRSCVRPVVALARIPFSC